VSLGTVTVVLDATRECLRRTADVVLGANVEYLPYPRPAVTYGIGRRASLGIRLVDSKVAPSIAYVGLSDIAGEGRDSKGGDAEEDGGETHLGLAFRGRVDVWRVIRLEGRERLL
jgi:hypothetical protein